MEKENVIVPAEFADICPISDKDFHNEMSILVEKPMFQQVVKFVMPDKKFSDVSRLLLSLNSKQEFQQNGTACGWHSRQNERRHHSQ